MICSCRIPIRRVWAMPSGETFTIPPVADLLARWLDGRAVIVDPFARNSRFGTITNDLNPETTAQHHMDARAFAAKLRDDGTRADAVLFDPPYSPRQISDCYQGVGKTVTMEDTQNAVLYAEVKRPLGDVLRPGGIAICCGWNSSGFGKPRGFVLREMLVVCHGAARNDTIITVEEKLPNLFDLGVA